MGRAFNWLWKVRLSEDIISGIQVMEEQVD